MIDVTAVRDGVHINAPAPLTAEQVIYCTMSYSPGVTLFLPAYDPRFPYGAPTLTHM